MRARTRTFCLSLLLLAACGDPADAADAGALADAAADGSALDAATDGGARMCAENLVSPYTGPSPCSTETRDCAQACEDFGCANDCFLDDPNVACGDCWVFNRIACWNRNGCQDEWNCVSECLQTHCPTLEPGCMSEMCGAEDLAYADCFEPLREMCGVRGLECLPE